MKINPYAITSSGISPELLDAAHEPYAPGIGEDGWLKTACLPDGVYEILLEDFTFESQGHAFTVPRGFVTDYASIPRFFHRILPQRGRYNPAAVAHDFLYWSGVLSKDDADEVLYDLSERLGVGWFDRHAIYRGVRIGGWVAWNKYRKAERRGGK